MQQVRSAMAAPGNRVAQKQSHNLRAQVRQFMEQQDEDLERLQSEHKDCAEALQTQAQLRVCRLLQKQHEELRKLQLKDKDRAELLQLQAYELQRTRIYENYERCVAEFPRAELRQRFRAAYDLAMTSLQARHRKAMAALNSPRSNNSLRPPVKLGKRKSEESEDEPLPKRQRVR
ncbi:MAG: hypothetical protein Q9162_007231 [Coniocarpon cinnabarinum]